MSTDAAHTGTPHIDEVVEELALGLIDEPRRSELLAHVDDCPRCRNLLDEVSATVDHVLLIAPEAEPPAGFESRAMAAMVPSATPSDRAPSRRRRWLVAAAVAAALVVMGGVGVVVGRSSAPADRRASALDRVDVPTLVAAPLVTPDGTRVGGAAVLGGSPPSLWMTFDGAEPGERYRCQVILADGSRHDVGVWSPKGRGRAWSIEVGAAEVGAKQLVVSDMSGSEVATAQLR